MDEKNRRSEGVSASRERTDAVLGEMERYGKRHWMHLEGQAVSEFANRLGKAIREERKEADGNVGEEDREGEGA